MARILHIPDQSIGCKKLGDNRFPLLLVYHSTEDEIKERVVRMGAL
jgi:hypothetical protein